MNFFKKNQTTVVAVGIIVLGVIAYFFFFQNDTTGPLTTSGSDPRVIAANQEFIALFSELRRIDLDTSLFEDEYYQGLVDFSQQIFVEPVGRDNPFAP